MTKEIAKRIVKGITDKIECNTADIDDWAEFWGFTREEYEEFLDMPIKALEQEPRWIPVSEKLPENKETVLVTFKHFVSGNTIGLGSVILLRGKPHWHVREQNLGTYDVLAWMPLPKAYSEVEK